MPPKAPEPGLMKLVQAIPDQLPLGELVGAVPFPGQPWLAVLSRQGVVRLQSTDPARLESRLLLDLSKVTAGFVDSGLLALAFHPEFGVTNSTNRGFFYVWYSYTPDRQGWNGDFEFTTLGRLSRFRVPDGSLAADPESEVVLIEQEDRHLSHAGGGMVFNPRDGFLYLSFGNEGKDGDPYGVTQQVDRSLYAGVIRIDVDQRGGTVSHPIRRQPLRGRTQHYYIPSDNPWVGQPDALEEFYAIGLRNPYRLSCDPETGRIFIFDVGDGTREEINLLEKGANYQYPYREGTAVGRLPRPATVLGTERGPFFEYGRDLGICVTGGVIYRGQSLADVLGGWLVFTDLGGTLYALDPDHVESGARVIARVPESWTFTSVNLDAAGELLVSHAPSGLFWRPVREVEEASPLPRLLSQTGAFSDPAQLEPDPALVPYVVTSPLWSDGAAKRRWMALPTDGASNRIERLPDGQWSFPGGTVFVKHFEIQTNRLDPAAIRRLETRLMVLQTHGGAYGVTYRWRPDGQDAEVLPAGGDEEIVIQTPDGPVRQTWHYPSMRECLQCHTRASGYVLGVTPAQLNRPPSLPGPGGATNQLANLQALGLLHPPLTDADLAATPALVDPADPSQPLSTRVRAYLESNCASCHRPGGVRAQFDARFNARPADQNLILGPVADDLGLPGTRVVVPGDLERSALYQRIATRGAHRMPPIGRDTVDPLAEALFREWILTLPVARLTSPEPDGRIGQGPLVLAAEVDHASAWVRQVEFLVDGSLAGVDATPPYRLELGELADGVYEVAAVVRGEDGTRIPGPARTVVLARGLPVVRLTQPGAGPVFDGALSLEMEATPAEGAELEQVELLVDGQPVAAGPGPRLAHRPSPLSPGLHVVRARAVDRDKREGWSAVVQVEVVPTPQVRWTSQTSDGLVLVARTNLVGRLSTVYDNPRWRGYWALLPDIGRGKPDALGGFDSIRLPSADLGAGNGWESGLFYSAQPRLEAGRYLVSLWARTLEGEMPLQYGLTDGFTARATLDTNWSRLTRTFDYTPCGCYQDERLFQLLESTPTNSPWTVALAEVVRLDDAPLRLEVDGRGGTVTRVRARLEDGTELEAIPGSWAFRGPSLPSGTYRMQLEVETASGLVHRPAATTLVIGPPTGPVAAPRLALPAPGTRIEEDPLVLVAGLESPSPWTRQVEFLVNGSLAGTAVAPPYRLEVNGLPDGLHEVVAAVRLADGSRVNGPAVQVQVARGLPVVNLRRPVAGPVFDQAFRAEVEAVADAGQGITQIELLVDGQAVFASAGGTGSVDLSAVAPGPHQVQARARDGRGRVGISPVVAVEVVPTPTLRWVDPNPEGVLVLVRTNWAGQLMQVYDDPGWRGYWAMLDAMEIDLPDLRGGAGAIRLPTGDLGPTNLALSGLFYQGGRRLAAGRYVVGVEARAVTGELPVRFGLTDGFTTPARLSTNWARLSATFQYQPCDCYQDDRVFQVMESVTGNPPWELAQAEVYRLEEQPLGVEVDGRGGKIQRVRARLADGSELEPLPGGAGFLAPALLAGVHRVRLLAETASGLVHEGPPITLVIGPALELAPGTDSYQHVRLRGVAGSRVRLESSGDLQDWSPGPVVVLEGPEMEIPWALLGRTGAPALFLRAVLQPAAAP